MPLTEGNGEAEELLTGGNADGCEPPPCGEDGDDPFTGGNGEPLLA